MLYLVQQKWGDNPYLRLNVALCAIFRAMFPGLKSISPKLLHEMQHSPSSDAKRKENVAFFAGFVASCTRGGAALTGSSYANVEIRTLTWSLRANAESEH